MTRLILSRHAEEGNAAEIQRLAAALGPVPLDAVYTSPLARARATADAVAADRELVAIDVRDLREIDFGDVEGVAFDDYPAELQAALLDRPLAVRFPGGESYGELQGRVLRALGEIVSGHPAGTIAVVTHAGPIRAALAAWLGITDAAALRLDQRTASVNVVDWLDGTPLIRLVNGTAP